MKAAQLIALFIFTSLFVQAQKFDPNQYSLKDYKAPEIKYQRLTTGIDSRGLGAQDGIGTSTNLSGNLNFNWYQYRNLKNYQGSKYTYMDIMTDNNSSKNTNNESAQGRMNMYFGHHSTNRFYREKMFIGVHPTLSYHYYNYYQTYEGNNSTGDQHQVNNSVYFNTVISAGMGRIEPVTAAREALDILTSLQKYNRLAKNPSTEEIDILAKRINEIKFKRFYDVRYKRVYQLQEIDSVLQGMGIVENADMVYASNLSDIWNYGITGTRGSGSRFEFGIVPLAGYMEEQLKYSSNEKYSRNNRFGGFVMANWSKLVPLNFKWQSNITIDGTAGITEYDNYSDQASNTNEESTWTSQKITAKWILGYFPNTRTYAGISPFASISTNQDKSESPEKDNGGILMGADFDSYYYFSPKFRVSLRAGVFYNSNEYSDRTPNYSTSINALERSNYPRSNSHYLDNNGDYNVNYQFTLGLNYAIF